MKLSGLALDYDGTTAINDVMPPSVPIAVEALRSQGVTVLLVTGRILSELRRVAGDLRFVDCVVAENGAVIHFPATGYTTAVGPPLPEAFVLELRRRGIAHVVGQCLVDAAAADAPSLLDIIRRLELPLVLAFNAGRVMILRQGISKATGLSAALQMLRLSTHNLVAIGDAENDHELLRIAEVGAAVEWGSPALRAAADLVIAGVNPVAVAEYTRGLALTVRIPVPAKARRHLRLGTTDDGREFSLAVLGRNVLVAGDAKSGKSWVAGLLCEQLILHGYCVCVIDPEGDYGSLELLPGVTVLGGDDPPPTPRELLRALRYPDRSVVVDLSHLRQDEKIEYIRAVLPALNRIRHQTGLPHRIVVDEAHYFLHEAEARQLLDLERNGYIVVTYWASRLPSALLAATEVMIVTRETDSEEIESLRRWCSTCDPADGQQWSMLSRIAMGHAVALPITAEAGGRLTAFALGPRLTPHVRHRHKYVDVAVAAARAFVFETPGAPLSRASTLRQFVTEMQRPLPELDGYLKRGDFSRWIGSVFGDNTLAAEVRDIERRHVESPDAGTPGRIAQAIGQRYYLTE